MNGVFIVSQDGGHLLFHKAFRRNFGMPDPEDVRALIACPSCRRRHVDDFNMGALIFALSTYADGVIAAGDTDADTASHGGSDDDDDDDAGDGDGGGNGGQATDASLQVYDMGHSRVHFAQRTHGSMRMLVAVFMEPDLPLDLGAATAADLGARFSAKYAARLDACPAGGVPTGSFTSFTKEIRKSAGAMLVSQARSLASRLQPATVDPAHTTVDPAHAPRFRPQWLLVLPTPRAAGATPTTAVPSGTVPRRFTTTSRPDWSLELLAPLAVSRTTTTTTTPSNPPTQPDPPTSPAPSKATVGRGAAAAASTATNPTPEARPAPGAEGTQPRAAARPWWRALCCVASTAAEPELPRGMDAAQLERIASRRRRSVSSKHSRALPAVADVDAAATGSVPPFRLLHLRQPDAADVVPADTLVAASHRTAGQVEPGACTATGASPLLHAVAAAAQAIAVAGGDGDGTGAGGTLVVQATAPAAHRGDDATASATNSTGTAAGEATDGDGHAAYGGAGGGAGAGHDADSGGGGHHGARGVGGRGAANGLVTTKDHLCVERVRDVVLVYPACSRAATPPLLDAHHAPAVDAICTLASFDVAAQLDHQRRKAEKGAPKADKH